MKPQAGPQTTASEQVQPGLPEAPRGLVLEIGGGHNPYPESDVIVDKFLENKERGGDLKIDRTVVIADFQQLPFKDGSFAHSICSHVLEHVEDVPSALNELSRVARGGYLETPSALNEAVEPHRDYHRWYVGLKGSKLVFFPKKPGASPQQSLLNRLLTRNASFKFFYVSNPDLAFTRLRWKNRVEYEVKSEKDILDLEALYPKVDQTLPGMLIGLARHFAAKLRRRSAAKVRARKPLVDIRGILCCPVCKSDFRFEGDKLICAKCAGYYPKQGGLYHLLKEDLRPL